MYKDSESYKNKRLSVLVLVNPRTNQATVCEFMNTADHSTLNTCDFLLIKTEQN